MKDLDKRISELRKDIKYRRDSGYDVSEDLLHLTDMVDAKIAIQEREEELASLKARNDILKEQCNTLKIAAKDNADVEKARLVIDFGFKAASFAGSLYLINTMRKIEEFGTVTTKTLPSIMNFLRMI